ncbi:reverse transcriptase [Gossypium australe]|uniref:Reverse transcriptase n=1 Tax=Gossypium australe TaxID=47621 RepID=A0A5B6V725_9ROSI|nr:reverse transcriptase [Gossypium australe]
MEEEKELALLEEELIQLSVKSSLVIPSENPTLICTVWTKKSYNPDNLIAQLKNIWKIKKKFEILIVGQNLFSISFEDEEDLDTVKRAKANNGRVEGHTNFESEQVFSQDSSELTQLYRRLPVGKPTRINEDPKLECLGTEESPGYQEVSTHVETLQTLTGLHNGDKTGSYSHGTDRQESWNLIRRLRHTNSGRVSGDFNEIMYAHEKKGGVTKDERQMEEFRKVLAECDLLDLGYIGQKYTWERGNFKDTNIRERRDRGVANNEWPNLFNDYLVQHLPRLF